ncbi:MAG: intradiol ring-cleavage dioxygenase [Bacteroidota bacterium]
MRTIFVVVSVIVASSAGQSQQAAPFPPAPSTVSSVATVVEAGEPGEPLRITGRVLRSDKETPYAGLVLYIYQTDASGVYNKTDNYYGRPRLYGWVKTDEQGNYEIRTIKPGSYPRRKEAAHIHVTAKFPGSPARWLESYLFSGDPNLSSMERDSPGKLGRFSHVLVTSKSSDGTLTAFRDFSLPN